ncbi:MAG: hypothetical protein GY929_21305 [Actinomycetia bacterium]|nr:hypothetical protein [Actinomycetes bacterium]
MTEMPLPIGAKEPPKALKDLPNVLLDRGDPRRRWPTTEKIEELDPDDEEFVALPQPAPLLLFPVRLEAKLDDADLLVRVQPDQIQIQSEATEPTRAEVQAGNHFWQHAAFDEPDHLAAAWRQLCETVGIRRVRFVADQTNPAGPPELPLAEELDHRPRPRPNPPPAATVAFLPERWIAVGYHLDQFLFLHHGPRIVGPLAVGVDAGAEAPTATSDYGIPVHRDGQWQYDFAEAEKRGMGLRIPLSSTARNLGELTTLLVFGAHPGASPNATAAHLAELLAGHDRSVGLGFVPPGSPTNNTGDGLTAWSRAGSSPEALLEQWLSSTGTGTSAGTKVDGRSNAAVLGRAVGFGEPGPLAQVDHGHTQQHADAQAMNTVLFEAVVGTFARHLLPVKGTKVDPQVVDDLRDWFIDEVSADGPIPTIRVGEQPYGVLPVAPLPSTKWSTGPRETVEDQVRHFVTVLRDVWEESLDQVPMLNPNAIDRQAGRARPTSEVPGVLASDPAPVRLFRHRFFVDHDPDIDGYLQGLAHLRTHDPVLMAMYDDAVRWHGPSATIEAELAKWGFLHRYIDSLPPSSVVTPQWRAEAHQLVDNKLSSLGRIELRQRPLSEAEFPGFKGSPFGDVSRYLRAQPSSARHELGLDPPFVTDHTYDLLAEPAVWLEDLYLRCSGERAESELPDKFRERPPVLHQLLTHTWSHTPEEHQESFLAALARLRGLSGAEIERLARNTMGLGVNRLDAWITSLATAKLDAVRDDKEHRTGLAVGAYGWLTDLELDAKTTSQGFVHAPSLAHATTAAVLRSAWLSHGTTHAESPAAVDLDSQRVRTALTVIDGIRQGVPLGQLLGVRFERSVREDPAPLSGQIRTVRGRVLNARPSDATVDEPVDGLVLLELHRANDLGSLPSGIEQHLAGLSALLDAIHDLALFEGTHATTQNQSALASAVFESMNQGTQTPPEFRSQRTSRPSDGVRHRVVLLADDAAPPNADGWLEGHRDRLAPSVERWLRAVFPAASQIQVDLGSTGTLDELGLSALDAAYLVGEDPSVLSAEFAQLVGVPPESAIPVPTGAGAAVGLEEFQLLAIEARTLIEGARPATATSLTADPDTAGPVSSAATAGSDASGLVIDALADEAEGLLADVSDDQLLRGASRFGIAGTIEQVAKRLRRAVDLSRAPASGAERAAVLFGRATPVVAGFIRPAAGAAIVVDNALASSDQIDEWLGAMGRVREPLTRLRRVRDVAGLLQSDTTQRVTGQHGGGTGWAATSTPGSHGADTLTLTALTAGLPAKENAAIGGLVIDSWSDHLPVDERLTGLAFHHDAPSAKAPQACLLATLPPEFAAWRLHTVAQVLLDTLQTAALRAVQPEDLADLGGVLPTLYLPELLDPWESSPQ